MNRIVNSQKKNIRPGIAGLIQAGIKHWWEILISLAAYSFFIYYADQKHPLTWLPQVSVLFFVYFRWFFFKGKKITNLQLILITGFLFRLLFLFHTPAMSDDYVRFIWDAKLNTRGENVYQSTPHELMSSGNKVMQNETSLFNKLNSPVYHSVYPPFSQLLFSSAFLLGKNISGTIMILRIFTWLAELALFFLIAGWLKKEKKDVSLAGTYFLNPLIITEWSGALHFEGIMITFFLLALWYARKEKWVLSAFFWACSASVKLLPLLFVPVIWKKKSFGFTVLFCLLVFGLLALSFFPFLSGNEGFFSSLHLYFQRFEFNAGIYFILRDFIHLFTGFNPIEFLVPALVISSLAIFILLFFKWKKNSWYSVIELLIILWSVWFFFSPVVHPWYITSIIVLASFSSFRYPYVWSATIFLSYFVYFNASPIVLWSILLLQYIPVFYFFFSDLKGFGIQDRRLKYHP